MIKKKISRAGLTVALIGAAALILAGCAAKTAVVESAPAPGIVLQYKMPAGQVLRYSEVGEVKESGEVMGQTIESVTKAESAFSFRAKGAKEGNHLLEATIENMTIQIRSMQGELSPDLTPVIGKSFDMVLSPLGTEVDVSGAESIQYEFMGSTRNLASGFKIFFPDLPEKPVEIGDTWPSNFTIADKNETTDIRIEMQGVCTLDGFETVDGMECARIKSEYTGTIQGTGNQQGAELYFSGNAKGSDIWHFAVKEGLYVKSASDVVNELVIDVVGPQNLTIPTTQTRKGEVVLVSR
jgi:hypothetical protein